MNIILVCVVYTLVLFLSVAVWYLRTKRIVVALVRVVVTITLITTVVAGRIIDSNILEVAG